MIMQHVANKRQKQTKKQTKKHTFESAFISSIASTLNYSLKKIFRILYVHFIFKFTGGNTKNNIFTLILERLAHK